MDERETIHRRDAMAGLGLLAALMVGLVGTIFYRIVCPSPPTRISLEGLAIAPEIEQPPLANQPQVVAPPEPVHQDGDVNAATFGRPAPAQGGVESQPQFIAPADR
jgi:hypothetical protein